MKKEMNALLELGITKKQLKEMSARIKERREELNMSQATLAKLCDLSNQSAIGHYEVATRVPSLRIIKCIAKQLKTTVDYLLHGIAPLYNFKPASSISGVRYVPVIKLIDAKNWEINMHKFSGNPEHRHVSVPSNISERSFCVEMNDDSMSAITVINNITFLPEDKLIFDPDMEAKIGKFILVEIPGVEIPVFRHFVESAGTFYLRALNPSYKMIEFKDEFKVLGVLRAKVNIFD